MKDTADALSLPVSELGFSTIGTKWLEKLVHTNKPNRSPDAPILLAEALEAFSKEEERVAGDDTYSYRRRRSSSEVTFLKKVQELGFTRLDFIYLPQETVTLKMQKSISKEEWRDKPVLLLGTMLPSTILWFAPGHETVYQVKVRHLLDDSDNPGRMERNIRQFSKAVEKTRALLIKLGFSYEDGGIMAINTVEAHAERLAKKHDLKLSTATKFVTVAAKEGWLRVQK